MTPMLDGWFGVSGPLDHAPIWAKLVKRVSKLTSLLHIEINFDQFKKFGVVGGFPARQPLTDIAHMHVNRD